MRPPGKAQAIPPRPVRATAGREREHELERIALTYLERVVGTRVERG
jgi:hypothetical protein